MSNCEQPLPLIVRQAEKHVHKLWLAIEAHQRWLDRCREEDAAIQLLQQQARVES